MPQSTEENFLESARKLFRYYKGLGEKAIDQLNDEQVVAQPNETSNSIALVVHHLNGNMLSRWTDFLNTDGEKEWRQRDAEFENDITSRADLMNKWNEGWNCLFNALNSITDNDLDKEIYIRNQGHSVMDAINRQLSHYPHHVGQIVFIGKMVCGPQWKSLSIPKGKSQAFNADKFSQPKHKEHFTDEFRGKPGT